MPLSMYHTACFITPCRGMRIPEQPQLPALPLHHSLCQPLSSVLRRAPTHTIAIEWMGDNTSALSKAQQNKCRSTSTQRTFVAYTIMQQTGGGVQPSISTPRSRLPHPRLLCSRPPPLPSTPPSPITTLVPHHPRTLRNRMKLHATAACPHLTLFPPMGSVSCNHRSFTALSAPRDAPRGPSLATAIVKKGQVLRQATLTKHNLIAMAVACASPHEYGQPMFHCLAPNIADTMTLGKSLLVGEAV